MTRRIPWWCRVSIRCAGKLRGSRWRSSLPTAAIHPGRIEEVVEEITKGSRRGNHRDGRAGGVRSERARPARRAHQARGAHEMAHELRPKHPAAFEGSGVARRDHGGGTRPRSRDGARWRVCCTTSARCLRMSTRGRTCSSALKVRDQVRGESARGELHRGAPRRRAA